MEDDEEEARPQVSPEEITMTGAALTICPEDTDFWYQKSFLITKPLKLQVLCVHRESSNTKSLPPRQDQVKHLKDKQHLSSASSFPYLNTEPKLGHKHCLQESKSIGNRSTPASLAGGQQALEFTPLASQQAAGADRFLKSKLQQQQ